MLDLPVREDEAGEEQISVLRLANGFRPGKDRLEMNPKDFSIWRLSE